METSDIIAGLALIISLVNSVIQWIEHRSRKRKEELEEQRFQNSQRKSLKIEYNGNARNMSFSLEDGVSILELYVVVTNDSLSPITLRNVLLTVFNEDDTKLKTISIGERLGKNGVKLESQDQHTIELNLDAELSIEWDKHMVLIEVEDTLGNRYIGPKKYLSVF